MSLKKSKSTYRTQILLLTFLSKALNVFPSNIRHHQFAPLLLLQPEALDGVVLDKGNPAQELVILLKGRKKPHSIQYNIKKLVELC